MQNKNYSQNLQAIVSLGNDDYQNNVKQRLNKYNRSQNTITLSQINQGRPIRRKSCYCSQCGQQSKYQFIMMNVPFQKIISSVPLQSEEPQLVIQEPELRKSLFYQKQSFKLVNDHKEMKLSLELHGLRRHINRQNTLLKLITDGQERSRRRENSLQKSVSDINSMKSLNITVSSRPSFMIQQQPYIQQPSSPCSLFSPIKSSCHKRFKFSKSNHNHNKILYNPNIRNNNKYMQITPIPKMMKTISTSQTLPRLSNRMV